MSAPPPELEQLVVRLRAIHLHVLSVSLDHTQTAGSCFYACVLLRNAVTQFLGVPATIRGGGQGDGGYLTAAGRQGHYWVEVEMPASAQVTGAQAVSLASRWVVDITADQFGEAPIVIEPLARSLPRYLPGNQAGVDAAVADFEREMSGARAG